MINGVSIKEASDLQNTDLLEKTIVDHLHQNIEAQVCTIFKIHKFINSKFSTGSSDAPRSSQPIDDPRRTSRSSADSKAGDARLEEVTEAVQAASITEANDAAKVVEDAVAKKSGAKKKFGKMARLVGVIQTAQRLEVSLQQ